MNKLVRWFIDNPIAANLLMAFILAAGCLSMTSLRIESFPQLPPSELVIEVAYPGGSAEQVDSGITQRIESAISGIAGIKHITSASHAGFATITVKKTSDEKLSTLMNKVRTQVDAIVGFPERAERPRIYQNEFDNLAAFVLVYGDKSDAALQDGARLVEKALKKDVHISKVTNLGKRRKALVIEPNPSRLQQYNLSFQDIAVTLQQWSLSYRSGHLDTARGKMVLRADDYADTLPELGKVPLLSTEEGVIRLSDVATIRRDFKKTDSLVRFNGVPAIALMISTGQKDDLLKVSEATHTILLKVKHELPSGINTEVMADMAPYIEEQLSLLGSNAWQGLIIVIVILSLFLEFRLALWVAMGIPVCIAGALWLMGLSAIDYSLNDITLFGMILVLGILVDDAVVVGESIHQARSQTRDPKLAAYQGVTSVSVATVFGVLTTIAAFSPMLWIENALAQLLAGFSAVVIFALVFSVIESKFILPSHLAFGVAKTDGNVAKAGANKMNQCLSIIRRQCVAALNGFSKICYQPILSLALNHKGSSLMVCIIVVLGAYGAMFKGSIRSVFFPEIPGRYATLKVEMDQDAAASLSRDHIQRIEKAIELTNTRLKNQFVTDGNVIKKYLVSLENTHQIEATVELSNEALAKVPGRQLVNEWKKNTGLLEGNYAQKFSFSEEFTDGTYFTISAPSRELTRLVANKIKPHLSKLTGVNDVSDDTQTGRRQLQITLNSKGVSLGLNQQQLAHLVGGAFGQIEIHRLLDKGEEYSIILRLPQDKRQSIQQLRNTPLMIQKGHSVTLAEIADFTFTHQPDILHRKNGNEVVTVYWRQDKSITSPQQTWQRLQETIVKQLHQQYPGVSIRAGGEFEEIDDVQRGFKKNLLLTLLLIYVLLAIPLKSYWQPFIIMSVIPIGFAGAIYGHGLLDMPVSILSLFGMMAMTGVVINDSLVLITRFNHLYSSGLPLKVALIEAGQSRLRAIFLTTLTTVCGLLPLLFETSEQAQYLKPAAVSLVFGELLATPITLILIPVLLSLGRYQPGDARTASSASDVLLVKSEAK